MAASRLNLLNRPDFEGTFKFVGLGTGGSASQNTTHVHDGEKAMRCKSTGEATQAGGQEEWFTHKTAEGLTGGSTVTLSYWLYVPSGSALIGKKLTNNLGQRTEGNTFLGNEQFDTPTLAEGWQRISHTWTLGATVWGFVFQSATKEKLACEWWIDSMLLEVGSEVLPYFDGSVAPEGWEVKWLGSAHDSRSQATEIAAEKANRRMLIDGVLVPVKRYIYVGGSSPTRELVHEDAMANSEFEKVWGTSYYGMKTPERVTTYSTGGDTRPKGDGSASNGKRRAILLKDGDRSAADSEAYERAMVGANESRYGEAGGSGAFALYQPGALRETWFSLKLSEGWPMSTTNWNLTMQMKQAQPFLEAHGSSPILAMQTINNKFVLVNNDTGNTDLAPGTTGRWVRFRFLVKYGLAGSGWLRIQIDDRSGSPTDWVPQYDTGVLTQPTLSYAVGKQEQGSPPAKYEDGQAIPSFLNLGVYRNGTAINGEVVIGLSNVQVYDYVAGSGGELVEVA